MKIESLSVDAQEGLRQWAKDTHGDELLFDDIASSPENWAWMWFQMRESPDMPKWFPKGKREVLQRIEEVLSKEAKQYTESSASHPE